MTNSTDDIVRAVFAADRAYVEASAVLLQHFRASLDGGLAFLFDHRKHDYKATSKGLTVTCNNTEVRYKFASDPVESAGCTLAVATGVPHVKDGACLYLCNLKGFRVGVLVDPTRQNGRK